MDSILPKKFIDDPATLVDNSIDGLIKASGGTLKRLDGYDKAIRVVVRSDYEENVKNANKLALITGGGSGHEPAHVGFIGAGMLTAAVCGDVFASPTVDAVLAAIKAVTGPAGCLLIIKNYTGDRLNFGLAAEKARSFYGLKVSSVVVDDDVALPEAKHPRGTAGTLFVHRYAGALAEEGKYDRLQIRKKCENYIKGIASVGASLTTCSLPGIKADTRLDGPEYELGLGIHGEPGAAKLPIESASAVLDRMVDVLTAGLTAKNSDHASSAYTLLVNNLGAVPPIEMTFLTGQVLPKLGSAGIKVSHVAIGASMTSLDMNGFSLSLAAHFEQVENPLLGDTGAPAWPKLQPVLPVYQTETQLQPCCLIPVELPEEEKFEGEKLNEEIKEKIRNAMNAVIALEPQLTEWDQKSGDGDCGATWKKGAEAILADLDSYPNELAALCRAISKTIGYSMGGSSGVLLSMFFLAAATELAYTQKHPVFDGFRAGTTSIMHYGGAQVGSCTMVDALEPAMGKMTLEEMAPLARAGAESTKELRTASHGRSQYLAGTDLSGIPDPGAMGIATIIEALVN